MRVVVNDIVAVPGSGGVYSVLKDFYSEVVDYNRLHKDVEWIFLLSGKFVEETDEIKVKIFPEIKKSWFERLKFEFISGKSIINTLKPDVYISLQNTMTLGIQGTNIWTYLHQPLPYQEGLSFSLLKKGERKMWVYQHLVGTIINYTIKHSKTKVIVQTKWMKDALLKRNICNSNKVVILPPNNVKVNATREQRVNTTRFFYPATGMPYKNHDTLFKAVRKLEKEGLVFSVDCTLTKNDTDRLGLKVPKSVNLLGIIPRVKVLQKYQDSIMVFPSLLETFGLPLLEASLSNGYILAGKTSFGTEILGDYSNMAFFNPESVDSIAEKMQSCIVNGVTIDSKAYIKVLERKNNEDSLVDLIVGNAK